MALNLLIKGPKERSSIAFFRSEKRNGEKRVNNPNEELENEKGPLSREDEKGEERKFNNNSYEEIILGPFL